MRRKTFEIKGFPAYRHLMQAVPERFPGRRVCVFCPLDGNCRGGIVKLRGIDEIEGGVILTVSLRALTSRKKSVILHAESSEGWRDGNCTLSRISHDLAPFLPSSVPRI